MTKKRTAHFLVLSTISGFFEIGAVFLGFSFSESLPLVILFALAYQLGTLFPYPFYIRRRTSMMAIGALVVLWSLIYANPSNPSLTFLFVFTASLLTNMTRVYLGKAQISTSLKRSFRILGFILSPLITSFFGLLLAVIATSILAMWTLDSIRPKPKAPKNKSKINTAMTATLVTHQMHYFCYYCVVLTTFLIGFNAFIGVVLFVAGWISYIMVPHIIPQKHATPQTAIFGHIALVPVLVGLSLVEAASPAMIGLWVLTGFFGGTVVFLTTHAKKKFDFTEELLATVENIGHCIGMTLALCWVLLGMPGDSLYIFAAMLALTTAFLLNFSI